MDCIEIELFPTGVFLTDRKGVLEETTKKLNNDLEGWEIVRVPVKHEFKDDLTEIVTYEWRYRLYLSKVYEELGFDILYCSRFRDYYWEKDKDGNMTNYYLP